MIAIYSSIPSTVAHAYVVVFFLFFHCGYVQLHLLHEKHETGLTIE